MTAWQGECVMRLRSSWSRVDEEGELSSLYAESERHQLGRIGLGMRRAARQTRGAGRLFLNMARVSPPPRLATDRRAGTGLRRFSVRSVSG